MKLNWNFQGEGVLEKIPPVGQVWIFSGTTPCVYEFSITRGSHDPFSSFIWMDSNSVCADDVTKLLAAMLEDLRNQNGD